MKRRDLFKMLGTLAAAPFVAPLVAMCKPKRIIPFVAPLDNNWSHNPIAAANGHVRLTPGDISDYFHGNPTYNSTLTMVARDFNPFMLKPFDVVTIGDDPAPILITAIYRHGEQP